MCTTVCGELCTLLGRLTPHAPLAYRTRMIVFSASWRALCVLVCVLWLASFVLACLPGPMDLAPGEVVRLLGLWAGQTLGFLDVADTQTGAIQAGATQRLDAAALLVVGSIRLPRVVLALCVGGGLGVAGAALQGMLRNPLADPFVLGISAGAACGASLAIAFGAGLGATLGVAVGALGVIAPAAMLGAFVALGLTLWLGRSGGLYRRDVVILAGVAVAAFLGAVVALVKALDEASVAGIVFWIMGSFQGRGWTDFWLLMPLVPGLVLIAVHWRELDVLSLGDDEAAQLGVAVRRSRLMILCGAGCVTAGCVAVAGVIGFVGLVAPHLVRRLLGVGHGPLLIGTWFGGGLLLVWADVLARSMLPGGQELPVGVVTALIGGPFFAWVVRRRMGGV